MTPMRPLTWATLAAGLTFAAGPAALTIQGLVAGDAAAAQGHENGHDHAAGGEAHDHGHASSGDASAAADLTLEPEPPQAGERARLTFALTDGQGEPLDELITHHARKLHVVIVGEEMQVLGHIHPQDFDEPIEGGEANVFFTFPRPGRYLVAADIMTEAGPYAEQFVLEVGGEAAEPSADGGNGATVAVVEEEGGDRYTDPVVLDGADRADGYEMSIARPDRIAAGEPATFTFRVTRGGAPVTDLRPYLDAPLHLAVVKQDFGAFLHEHGTAAGEAGHEAHGSHGSHDHGAGAAHDANGGGHGHGAHGYQGPAQFGPELTATFTFPEPGQYALFGQAAHGEKLLIARFPVEVE